MIKKENVSLGGGLLDDNFIDCFNGANDEEGGENEHR